MDDQRVGSAVRAVRRRRAWRQADLAARAGVSISTVSRLERGHLGTLPIETVRRIAAVLDMRLEVLIRWRSGDLDRLLNARHSRLHESVAAELTAYPGWTLAPEVSFAIYGERGVIDCLAWNGEHRALLVIELKTDVVDVNELIGTFDRKVRLAPRIARERGWSAVTVSGWVIVAHGRTNRARLAAHKAVLRAAFPLDGRSIGGWLRRPVGRISALSTWQESHPGASTVERGALRRVERPIGPAR